MTRSWLRQRDGCHFCFRTRDSAVSFAMVPFRSLQFALALVVLFLPARSSLKAPYAAEISDHSAALRSWLAAQTNIQTWSADFVQTRTLKALAQPLTASGHVWFAAPNRFRWELGQ